MILVSNAPHPNPLRASGERGLLPCDAVGVKGLPIALTLVLCAAAPVWGQPGEQYTAIVASEAADTLTRVRFGPGGLVAERTIPTGLMPTDIDGPHGVAVAPDGRSYLVTLAHGQPEGALWKYSAADDRVVGRVTLGPFPATVQVTPNGDFAYVVNFNLHGDRTPSSVSVVATAPMLEVARIPTCLMPHGSRFNAAGTRHYSACMMDDLLVEIDSSTMRVARQFVLTRGREGGRVGATTSAAASREHAAATHAGGHGAEAPPPGSEACSPTWAQPSSDGRRVFVACNGTSEIVDVDVEAWSVTRRLSVGSGVYNLAVTHDGRRLLATNRRGQSVSVFDLASGRELARVATKRRVVHGVVVTSDDRYAFVTAEGVGSDPGAVEVLDLTTLTIVASLDVASQAGGVDIFR
jgi:DNA-binding beta-propeller fold protein YncE